MLAQFEESKIDKRCDISMDVSDIDTKFQINFHS
jgi:hypothetical protein